MTTHTSQYAEGERVAINAMTITDDKYGTILNRIHDDELWKYDIEDGIEAYEVRLDGDPESDIWAFSADELHHINLIACPRCEEINTEDETQCTHCTLTFNEGEQS